MSQAIVDPGELRRFANTLKKFVGDLQGNLQAMNGMFLGLSSTWRDQEHQKFADQFEQTMLALSRFVEVTSEHVPFLLRKADRVEEYLQQR